MTILPSLFHRITDYEELGKRTDKMLERIAEGLIFYNSQRDIEEEYGTLKFPPPKEAVLLEGRLMPEFEKLKKDPELQEKFLEALAEEHHVSTIPKERLRKYLKLAIDATEEVAKILGKEGRLSVPVEELEKLENLNKFLDALFTKEFYARKRQTYAKPAPAPKKFPEVQKEVEKELAAKGEEKSRWEVGPLDISVEARELLGMLKGLRLAGRSEEAVDGLKAELWGRIDGLLDSPKKNLALLGLYVAVLRLVERGDFEGAERLLRNL